MAKMTEREYTMNFPRSAEWEKLTNNQKEMLCKFAERVKDVLKPYQGDDFLLRWLRARKYDMDKAETMLRKHVKLYKNLGMDNMIDCPPRQVFDEYGAMDYIGDDKRGHAIIVHVAGYVDPKGFTYCSTFEDIPIYLMSVVDKALTISSVGNFEEFKPGKKVVVILDFSGMKLTTFLDRAVLKQQIDIVSVYEANFPELMDSCYLINVPSYFYAWYNIVKVFLDPVTQNKIKVYTTDGWLSELLKIIDEDVLPPFLKGIAGHDVGNPKWYTSVYGNIPVPKSFHIDKAKEMEEVMKKWGATEICVAAQSSYIHEVCVDNPGQMITWKFRTSPSGIGFGISYTSETNTKLALNTNDSSSSFKNNYGNSIFVMPIENVDSHRVTERGELYCEQIGTYRLHFDNTASWLRAKRLFCVVNSLQETKERRDTLPDQKYQHTSENELKKN